MDDRMVGNACEMCGARQWLYRGDDAANMRMLRLAFHPVPTPQFMVAAQTPRGAVAAASNAVTCVASRWSSGSYSSRMMIDKWPGSLRGHLLRNRILPRFAAHIVTNRRYWYAFINH